jgi:type II secretory pathway pseudopilin PulG
MRTSSRQDGFTLIGLLFLVAGLGVAMAALGTVWHTHAQREKEAELLFIGGEYARAIASYQRMTPGAEKKYPPNLEALLADARFPNTVRHLRRLYRDPITGAGEWGTARDEAGGITGVYSLSERKPMKKAGFGPGREAFADAETYQDWVFVAVRPSAAAPAGGGASSVPPKSDQPGKTPPQSTHPLTAPE